MKKIAAISVLCAVIGCSGSSSETSVKDTTQLSDSVIDQVETKAETSNEVPDVPVVISDSAANTLNSLVNAEFEIIYHDTANCYKVVFIDYFDEWEGQAEMKETTWYFSKEFSIVYGTYSYQNGAMEQPDVIEFAVKDNGVTATKEFSLTGYEEKALTRWATQKGGVILKLSYEQIKSIEYVPVDYGDGIQKTWDINLNALRSTVISEDLSADQEVYTILKEVPKPAELMDYTKWIIPKVVYDKLKAE